MSGTQTNFLVEHQMTLTKVKWTHKNNRPKSNNNQQKQNNQQLARQLKESLRYQHYMKKESKEDPVKKDNK